MIDCLSNPDWIKPQMDFLVYLQNIRINCSDIFDKFFLSITIFGEFWLPTIICAIVYWCIDFKAGIYLFSLASFNKFIAHLFKMLACVYRPWVLDSRIHPSELAIPYAKGYSFPSGHSSMASAVLGGCAYLLRKHKIWSIFLICLVLLVGFSRLWLGVHSPQDVVVGLLTGFLLVGVTWPLINWAEKNPNRYILLLIIIDVLAIVAMIYMCFFTTYRMDYVSGHLLVNPEDLKYDTLMVYSYSLGLINGCYLCARFSPFNPKDIPLKSRIIIGIIGSAGIIIMIKLAFNHLTMNAVKTSCAMSVAFLIGIIITLIYPIIFTKVYNWKNVKY